MKIDKIELPEKISFCSPELVVEYPPPYNKAYAFVRSPCYLTPIRKKSKNPTKFKVTRLQTIYHALLHDTEYLYETMAKLATNAINLYYEQLKKEEIYKIPDLPQPESLPFGEVLTFGGERSQ